MFCIRFRLLSFFSFGLRICSTSYQYSANLPYKRSLTPAPYESVKGGVRDAHFGSIFAILFSCNVQLLAARTTSPGPCSTVQSAHICVSTAVLEELREFDLFYCFGQQRSG